MTTTPATLGRRGSWPRAVLRAFLLAVLVLFVALLVFIASLGDLLTFVLGLFAAGAIGIAAYRWPTQAMLSMLVIVPMSRFISFVVFGLSDSFLLTRASQLLKDEILIAVVFGAINLAFLRRRAPRVHLLDLGVVAYLAIVLLYVSYPGVDGSSESMLARVLAWRQDAFFVLAYFIGRGVVLTRRDLVRAVKIIVVLSVAVAGFAVLQFAFPDSTNGVLNKLGFARFMAAVGTPHEVLAVRSRGIGGADLPRASSFFLADLGLAYFQLIVIPIAASLFVLGRGNTHALAAKALFVLLMIGVLGLTVTRSAVAAAGLGLVFILFLRPSYLHAAVILVAGTLAAVVFALVEGVDLDSLTALASLSEGSAQAHLTLIQQALATVQEFPLGLGLGNGSHVANQLATFGVALPLTAAESWYLQLGLEMGVVGMAAFTVMLLGATFVAMANYFRVQDDLLRVVTLSAAAMGVSLLAIGVVQPVWAAVHVTVFFWLFIGIAVRAPQLEQEWRRSGQLPAAHDVAVPGEDHAR